MAGRGTTRASRARRVSALARLAMLVVACNGAARAQGVPQGAGPQVQPARSSQSAVSVVHEGGVEIITSRTIAQTPAAAGASGASDPSAQRGTLSALPEGTALSPFGRSRQHAPMNATLPARDPGMVADDVRGDHRLRANLLNSDGTANEQADNSAHQLVNARRAESQADLKDALVAFDAARRNGASRTKLNELQAQIRTDLDEIHILTRSQQSGAQ
ncbi:hypothetical protein [Paraburkholderia sartisoli]|uniref:DUF4142 domain-containing protein n=1 Tax=Paraburkholderia sartisoli TaxID=83784 RepID=A0A1H3XYJ2_9BURK|nr:hypothetical protein [Paraburkholderia sartisoli]SEA03628.1 hypothetical protein SAMN05192564_10145 [Paraburkholderia sartisoli]